VAAPGAGVDHRRHYRGVRRRRFRGDRFYRAHAYPGSIPGGPDFVTGGTRVGQTDSLQRACLAARVHLGERIIVPGNISAGQRVCFPIGAFIQVADRIRIPEPIPVCFPDPLADPVSVHIGLGEHITVRGGIGFYVAGADADPWSVAESKSLAVTPRRWRRQAPRYRGRA